MRYFIKIDSVSAGESGLITEGKKQLLILDVSYHDKCDLTYSEYLNPETGEVEVETFNKVLKNASKYNKTLREEIN
jgi:hypothetical protein|nr:MAG TPA: hypothetical protein [Caudoviricetes sp.]